MYTPAEDNGVSLKYCSFHFFFIKFVRMDPIYHIGFHKDKHKLVFFFLLIQTMQIVHGVDRWHCE